MGGMPKAIVFDLDGTLVDSAPDLHVCINQLLGEMGLPSLSLAQVTQFIGEGIPPLIAQSLAAVGMPASGGALDVAVARYKEIYAAAPAALTRPYAGVAACLETLKAQGAMLGVCTNKSEPLARQVVDAVGLGRCFEVIVGGDTLPTRKPDPAPLLHTARGLGVPPAQAVYVGDSEIDAAAAMAAGLPFLLFTRGYRKAPVEALPHVAAFDDFGRLAGLIADLGR